MNFLESRTSFAADKALHEAKGVIFPEAQCYIPEDFRMDWAMAMDAQPSLTTTANSGIPALYTTMVDPQVYQILYAPNKAGLIFGEEKRGTWVDDTTIFPLIETTGDVASYGDFDENGRADANANFPQRQSYLFQTIIEYGEREAERADKARLNWVGQKQRSAATVLDKYQNLTYFFGVSGLQNYGLLNDPNLTAALTPATKAWGGTQWISGGQIKATANEIFADIQAMVIALVNQSDGLIEEEDEMTLAMSPGSKVALTATNSFAVNVNELIKQNFPKMKVETATQYGAVSATNPQGVVGGNFVQLIASTTEGQKTGFCAFNEKMRAHKLIPATSSYKQKQTSGSWGAVIRQPFAISQLLGV